MAGGQFHLDPETYLAAIRAEVPAYDQVQDAVAGATAKVHCRDLLDLGTGTGETALRLRRLHPGAHVTAVDSSPAMVAIASAVLPASDVRVARLEDPLPHGGFDVVVSAFAVHHLTADGKADLFRRIEQRLRPGGRFVLADVIVPDDPGDAVTPLEAGVDLPERLDDLLGWLLDAGLTPSVVWQAGDLVVLAADRTADRVATA